MEHKTLSKKESWKDELDSMKRESSLVKEISARFTGNSVPITEAEFQKQLRMRAYAKIKSFNYVSKNNIKNLNSPRKQLLMKEWSEVVATEKVGVISSQTAIDFLEEYGVHQNGMDEEQWKEWLEAIDNVTTGVQKSRSMENLSAAVDAEANAAATAERNEDIALQIEAVPLTPVSHANSSRSLSPADVLTYTYDETSTPFVTTAKPTPQENPAPEDKEDLTDVATRLSLDDIAVTVSEPEVVNASEPVETAQTSNSKRFSYSKLETNSDSTPKHGSDEIASSSELTPLVNSLNSNASGELLDAAHSASNVDSSELDTNSNRTESTSDRQTTQQRVNSTGSTKNPLTLNASNNVSDKEYSPKNGGNNTATTTPVMQPINVSSLPAQGTTKFVRPPLEPSNSVSSINTDNVGSSMCSEYTTTTEDEENSALPPVLHIDSNMSVISSIGDDDAATAHNPNTIIKVAPVYHIDQHSKGSSSGAGSSAGGNSMKNPVANSSSAGGGAAGTGRSLNDDEAEDDSVASRRQGNFFGCFFACCFKQPPKKKKEDKGKLIDKNSVQSSSGGTHLKRSLDE